MKKYIILFLVTINSIITLHAQDLHYSQYYSCPLYLNPANTGNFSGDWRIAGNYRNQWSFLTVPYTTFSASYDQNVYLFNQSFGAGLLVMNDESGDIGLNAKKIYLSGSYSTILNDQELMFGIQAGYVFKSIQYDDLTFPDQFNIGTGYFDPSLSNGEAYIGERLSYPDVHVGLNWNGSILTLQPRVGVAVFHVNHPRESFLNEDDHVPFRSVVHFSLNVDIGSDYFIEPRFLMLNQVKAKNMMFGLHGGYRIRSSYATFSEVSGGIYMRNGFNDHQDALTFALGTKIKRLNFIISYDINISSLETVSHNKGGIELSFIYKSISSLLKSYSIPCERY